MKQSRFSEEQIIGILREQTPWRSVKHECVYLQAFETGSELRAGLARWIGCYNTARPHSAHGGRTPDKAYGPTINDTRMAA